MSNGNPYVLELLHRCRHPDLHVRLRALDDLEKEYLDQVKADFLLPILHRATTREEQTTLLGMLGQLGPRAPVDELTTILLDRADSNQMPRDYVAVTLAALGESAPVDVFIKILQDPTEEAGLREEIAGLLGQFYAIYCKRRIE